MPKTLNLCWLAFTIPRIFLWLLFTAKGKCLARCKCGLAVVNMVQENRQTVSHPSGSDRVRNCIQSAVVMLSVIWQIKNQIFYLLSFVEDPCIAHCHLHSYTAVLIDWIIIMSIYWPFWLSWKFELAVCFDVASVCVRVCVFYFSSFTSPHFGSFFVLLSPIIA